jgi:hypothetical protein
MQAQFLFCAANSRVYFPKVWYGLAALAGYFLYFLLRGWDYEQTLPSITVDFLVTFILSIILFALLPAAKIGNPEVVVIHAFALFGSEAQMAVSGCALPNLFDTRTWPPAKSL